MLYYLVMRPSSLKSVFKGSVVSVDTILTGRVLICV